MSCWYSPRNLPVASASTSCRCRSSVEELYVVSSAKKRVEVWTTSVRARTSVLPRNSSTDSARTAATRMEIRMATWGIRENRERTRGPVPGAVPV